MRWSALFGDLEAQADALAHAERAAEVETRTRGEIASIAVRDRLRAALGTALRMRLTDGTDVEGVVERVGPDWALLADPRGQETVVVTERLVLVRGLGRASAAPDSMPKVESRLGLRHALRGIARDRSAVRVHVHGSGQLDGTIDRVGADFIELASHPTGEARRRTQVRAVDLIPLSALLAVRRSA